MSICKCGKARASDQPACDDCLQLKALKLLAKDDAQAHIQFQASLIEPLWYLLSIPYQQYRVTHYWRNRSQAFRDTFEGCPFCELCNLVEVSDDQGNVLEHLPQFHVHHICYDHLGCEPDEDLRLVCSACHNLIHNPLSHAARNWLDLNPTTISPATLAEFVPRPFKNNFLPADEHQSMSADTCTPATTVGLEPSPGHGAFQPSQIRAGSEGVSLNPNPSEKRPGDPSVASDGLEWSGRNTSPLNEPACAGKHRLT